MSAAHVNQTRRSDQFKLLLLASAAAFIGGPAFSQEAGGLTPPPGRELPVDPRVVAGDVGFSYNSPTRLVINQSSNRAIVNFKSFDIAADAGVTIQQNGPLAALLGRVTGQDGSIIAGSLTSNGQFLLVNPNGIAITNGAIIDTGAFAASTLDIADADFLSGNLTFRRAGRAATVVNQGTIRSTQGVALIGSGVVNEGVVEVRLGRIGYGAGDQITVDFSGDRFLQVALPVSDAAGLTDALGRPLSSLIQAGGVTRAEGGRIYLSAQGARALMLGAVKVDGALIATSVREGTNGRIHLGNIAIDGGTDGLVQITGRVDASGGTGLDGGAITVAGGFLGMGGLVDASGGVNGGSVTLDAGRSLSLADQIAAVGRTGRGGRLTYTSGGNISEIVGSVNNASGGVHGGVISVAARGDLATSGDYLASGFLGYGGRVDMTADSVRLLSTRIDASGGAMGGLVRIGGAFQGGAQDRTARADYASYEGRFGPLPGLANARTTFVNDGVAINVGSARGQGGSAVIWSDDLTTMLGSVLATGRRDGGWVEVSGKETLRYVDLTRINTGPGGGLLLDPRDIVIGDFAQAQAWQYAGIIGTGLVDRSLNLGADLEKSDNFGQSVSLNAAGDRLAVGAIYDDGFGNAFNGSGSVRLFTFTNTSFAGGALAATIGRGYTGSNNLDLGTALETGDFFGSSVSLNAAGDRLAVGATGDDGFGNGFSASGSVRLFSFTDTSFGGGAILGVLGAGYVGVGDLDLQALGLTGGFGSSVALNGVGDRLALGSTAFSNSTGAVHLFTASGSGGLAFGDNAAGTSNVSAAGLAAALATGTNITLEASNDITLASALNVTGSTGGTLSLTAGRSILLNASITTANGGLNLLANTGGSVLATVNANRQTGAAVITMGAGTTINAGTGAVNFTLTPGTGLTTPTSGSVTLNSITAGTIAVVNAGPTAGSNIVLNSGAVLTASGTGRAIDLQARTGTFTNNAGTGAFSLTGSGTYGVFSDDPDNTLEGVTGFTRRYNIADAAAFAGFAPAGANVIAYRIAPVLTVTADSLSRFYGNANPTFTSSLTGFLTGDTAANSTTGAAGLGTTAGLTTGVGSATITASLGTLASDLGYQFNFVNGVLNITPRPITLTADSLSRIYGNANPNLTFAVGGDGLVNGDTVSGALATTASAATGIGNAAITQGTLAASANYSVTYVGGVLNITPRPITLTADSLSRLFGQQDPTFTYRITLGALQFADTLSGALGRAPGENPGLYPILIGTVGNPNYAITYIGGGLTITPAQVSSFAAPDTAVIASLISRPDPMGTGSAKDGFKSDLLSDLVSAAEINDRPVEGQCQTSAGGVCLPSQWKEER